MIIMSFTGGASYRRHGFPAAHAPGSKIPILDQIVVIIIIITDKYVKQKN